MELIETYFMILLSQFQWDVAVMSQPWMYYWALIPIMFFLMFFCVKWMILFLPVIIPVCLVCYWTREIILAIKK